MMRLPTSTQGWSLLCALVMSVLPVACGGSPDDGDTAAATTSEATGDATSTGASTGESSSGGDSEAQDSAEPMLTDIVVIASYDEDPVPIAVGVTANRDNPAMSIPLAYDRLEDPTFPATLTLRGLEPGTYYVGATVDFEPASPAIPGEEDITGELIPVTVDGEPEVTIEVSVGEE